MGTAAHKAAPQHQFLINSEQFSAATPQNEHLLFCRTVCTTTVKHASICMIRAFVRAHETYSVFLVPIFSLPLTDPLVLFLPFLVPQLVIFCYSHYDIHTRKLLNCFVITFLIALKSHIFNTFLVSFTL